MTARHPAPASMRAVEITQAGGPEVLRLCERPVPSVLTGEILVKVAAAGLNRGDIFQRQGNYPPPPGASDLPGLEVSGTVVAVGPRATGFEVGQEVCALLAGGGYAEYCSVPATHCAPIPRGVSLIDAAALPEAFCTVWGAVWLEAGLADGESLLVQGGSSGIGVAAIQMAAALGHSVYTTAGSDEKCAACVELGATRAINYQKEDFSAVVRTATAGVGVDVILDMVGGNYVPREISALADYGRLVFISALGGQSANIDIYELMRRRLKITGSTLRSRPRAYKSAIVKSLRARIWPHIASGKIRPVVDRRYGLHEVAAAHAALEAGGHVGKILLVV
jgi:NADPH2:quinone reductase